MTFRQRLLIFPIRLYQSCISPFLPPRCRFYPSCSTYAIQAIETHGPLKGLLLAAGRLLRCHPGSAGGIDPVPPASAAKPSAPCPGPQDRHGQ
jgi:putative membrane protein insertion efficiency factor